MPSSVTSVKRTLKIAVLLLCLLWLGLLATMAYNWRTIQDWWYLRNYNPPTAIVRIADQDTLTPYARKILYVNHPQLEERNAFTQCQQQNEKPIVLGCYHGNQSGIFVLGVNDSRLNGVEQVTTAHEMLHAAYDRLSQRQKQAVDKMLQSYYDHDLHDQRILDTIAEYRKTEPTAVVDEMHSVFGTEVAKLPSDLEAYYRRYFTTRTVITDFADAYEGEFTSRLTTIKADDSQLANLKAQINTLKTQASQQSSELELRRAQLEAERSAGSTAAYNAGVPGYNAAVSAYNATVDQLKSLISQYNQLVDARNALALETQQLQAEITTQPSTVSP